MSCYKAFQKNSAINMNRPWLVILVNDYQYIWIGLDLLVILVHSIVTRYKYKE